MSNTPPPRRVFVVPYRDRVHHKFFFETYMATLLEDATPRDYEIYFSHQHDDRPFNRGATKNIGFLAVRDKYPDHYRDMTFVFHDIDTLPFHKSVLDYQTEPGVVKHYYGFTHALGGIVAIRGADFERVNGYPNCWAWGNEDTVFQRRCLQHGLTIDRSRFHKMGSPQILQLFDGIERVISKEETQRARSPRDDGVDGLHTIQHLLYTVDRTSSDPVDNVYVVGGDSTWYINILHFVTGYRETEVSYYEYDLREPIRTPEAAAAAAAQARQQPPGAHWTGHRRVPPPTRSTSDWTEIPPMQVRIPRSPASTHTRQKGFLHK